MSDNRSTRREFIAAGVGTAAGAAAVAGVTGIGAAAAVEETPRLNGMPTRRLPRSGKVVPIFGCGVAPISQTYNTTLTFQERVDVLRHAYDQGVRYFDTAAAYQSEDVVGEALKGVRDQAYINTKIGSSRGVESAAKELERSYQLLQTEVIDCVKIHMPSDYDQAMRVVDLLEQHKAQGRIANIGNSNHIHFEVTYRMIDTGRLDETLLARCYFPKGMVELISPRNAEFRELAIARACELGMNLIGMKALGGGIFGNYSGLVVADYDPAAVKKLPAAAIRWAFSDPRFDVYLIGVANAQQVDAAVQVCSADLAVTNQDRMLLADFSSRIWDSEVVKGWPEVYKTADSTGDVEKINAAVAALRQQSRGTGG